MPGLEEIDFSSQSRAAISFVKAFSLAAIPIAPLPYSVLVLPPLYIERFLARVGGCLESIERFEVEGAEIVRGLKRVGTCVTCG